MDEPQESADEVLRRKFPDLEPGKKPTMLGTLNGIGAAVYGKRDLDAETGTYVKTHFVVFLFIPIFALGAYRVADAPGQGWYILGREPLSGACKLLNLCVLSLVLVFGGAGLWSGYTSSAEYKAAQKLEAARASRDEGRKLEALQTYLQIVDDGAAARRAEAIAEAKALYADGLAPLEPAEAVEMLGLAAQRQARQKPLLPKDELLKHAQDRAAAWESADPRLALRALRAVQPLDPDGKLLGARLETLLIAAQARHPDDAELAGELALRHYERQEYEACKRLLEPLADKLGASEGARVLGQLRLEAGEFEQALPLLRAYCDSRLKSLHHSEQRYEQRQQQAVSGLIDKLDKGAASDSWYATYKKQDDAGQTRMVQEWLAPQLKANPALEEARQDLAREAAVVPVALDLGVALLRHAQAQDGEARQKSLQEAEQAFLAIGGMAGESDEYRIYYGQVLYWLGRHADGAKLFEEFLASKQRAPMSLMAVAGTYRNLGDHAQARLLLEEAYAGSKDPKELFAIAMLRRNCSIDLDDKELWLKRCDLKEPHVRSDLEMLEGEKAERDGDDKAAERHYREASRIYDGVPIDSATLNNHALCFGALFGVTGDLADYRRHVEKLEASLKLQPDHAVILGNVATALQRLALLEVLAPVLDFKALPFIPDYGDLALLYRDEAGRAACMNRLLQRPEWARARVLAGQWLTVSPHNAQAYEALLKHERAADGLDGLRELLARLQNSGYDPADANRASLEACAGKHDAELLRILPARLALLEAKKARFKERKGPGYAKALVFELELLALAQMAGQAQDTHRMLALAREAWDAHPSGATRSFLVQTLANRILADAGKADTELAASMDRTRYNFGYRELLLLALERPAWRQRISAHADFKALEGLVRDTQRDFPNRVSAWEAAFARAAGWPEAAALKDKALAYEADFLENRINRLLAPLSSTTALEAHGYLTLRDQPAEARALLKDLERQGIPMPNLD
ncbi:MAG: hypothetical protein M5U26_13445 [Planctomycetota bacterium]|nr:hypothetical protein [Planctomycetota bacterium]